MKIQQLTEIWRVNTFLLALVFGQTIVVQNCSPRIRNPPKIALRENVKIKMIGVTYSINVQPPDIESLGVTMSTFLEPFFKYWQIFLVSYW